MGVIIVQAPPILKIPHLFERIARVSGILLYITFPIFGCWIRGGDTSPMGETSISMKLSYWQWDSFMLILSHCDRLLRWGRAI
jgi:hypothetical protein